MSTLTEEQRAEIWRRNTDPNNTAIPPLSEEQARIIRAAFRSGRRVPLPKRGAA